MLEVSEIIKKAADKGGFKRVRFVEDKIPSTPSNIVVLPFFGDLRSTFILSSILLKRYRDSVKGSKYFILVSWPGFESLFPYVDEYWTIRNDTDLETLLNSAVGLTNTSGLVVDYHKNLNYFFEVCPQDEFSEYYHHGLKRDFFDKFGHIKKFLPSVPSTGILGGEFVRSINKLQGMKVIVFPTKRMYSWSQGKEEFFVPNKKFWIEFVVSLRNSGFSPILCQNFMTYDLSSDLTDNYLYITDSDISKMLGAMRHIGCMVDVFNDTACLAIAARCPYISFRERGRYNALKDQEIDCLCGENIPKSHIFSFSTIIKNGESSLWKINLFDAINSKLLNFIPNMNREDWPSTSESEEVVLYDKVKKNRMKKLGTKFIKVERD